LFLDAVFLTWFFRQDSLNLASFAFSFGVRVCLESVAVDDISRAKQFDTAMMFIQCSENLQSCNRKKVRLCNGSLSMIARTDNQKYDILSLQKNK